jgi:hypothetical protein
MPPLPPHPRHRIWSPVQHGAADSLLLVLIASFAATVLLVRLYLELTGFPQVGGKTFHLAHALWGGLLLFGAVALLLIVANRWALWLGAILGGIGIGLFIDEVGKLITRSVDYFYPLAFPIIYALLLICVWAYIRLRRARPRGGRALLYQSLEQMQAVLDNRLDQQAQARLAAQLATLAAHAADPDHRLLAEQLLGYVGRHPPAGRHEHGRLMRLLIAARFYLSHHPSLRVLKLMLVGGFGVMVVQGVIRFANIYALSGGRLSDAATGAVPYIVVNAKATYAVNHPSWLLFNLVMVILVAVLALAAIVLLASGHDRRAMYIGALALVLALTVVDLVTFYFNQFYTVGSALFQLSLLGAVEWYRWRLERHSDHHAAHHAVETADAA